MKKLFTIPNILTVFRIIGTFCLFFSTPFSAEFYTLYTLTGVSDSLDGMTARLLNQSTPLGAKLDSISDIIFWSVVIFLILPALIGVLPIWVWIVAQAAALVRAVAYVLAAVKYKRFSARHTYLSKLTGFSLFFVPFFINFSTIVIYSATVSVIAFLASLEELMLDIFEKEYNEDTKSIFPIPTFGNIKSKI